ncbi:MAG: hypothetical protein ABIT47_01655 [Candidatus Paceibacterota bacterium]
MIAGIAFATPASAQQRCSYGRGCVGSPSAPDAFEYDQRRGYNGGGYYNDRPTIADVLIFSLLRPSNKHHAGDMCYTPSGQVLGLDDRKKWYVVPGVTSFGEKGSITAVKCDQFVSQR